MDRVRLGRALGYGTRHAARTVAALAEAATAPGPDADSRAAGSGAAGSGATAARTGTTAGTGPAAAADPLGRTAPATEPTRPRPKVMPATPRNLGQGVQHFKRSFWGPLATFSSALWLRVTGLFFALIAFAMGSGAWRLRASLHGTGTAGEAHRLWVFTAFALLFGYFSVSSFVRATLRERRAAGTAR